MGLECEPLQLMVKGANLVRFLDSRFVGELNKQLSNVEFVQIQIMFEKGKDEKTDKPILDSAIMFHRNREEYKIDKLVVDANDSDTLNKIKNAFEAFYDGCPDGDDE